MKIGIIAAGNVGGTLGRRWAEGGHDVVFGVRDPSSSKAKSLVEAAGGKARAAALADAGAHGEVLALTTPWPATEQVLKGLGGLGGKVLLDCTNPLNPNLSLATGEKSGAEQVASWAPGARVVKIFNTTGFNNMEDPKYGDQAATMFLAGDEAEAKSVAARLAEEIGFETVDAGPLANARLLEPLAVLWIYLAYRGGFGRSIAFKLLRR